MTTDEATDELTPVKRHPRLSRTRSITAWVLVVLVSILFPLSVMTVWVVNTTTNTDRYVETMAPIATNPVVINAVSVRITDELFSSLNVDKRIASVLPKKAKPVAAPLTNSLKGFVNQQVLKVLDSSFFQKVWNDGNRRVHATLIALLSGQNTKSTRVLRNGNTLVINIAPVATKVITALDKEGIPFFNSLTPVFSKGPSKGLSISIVSQQQAKQATGLYNFTLKLKWLVPLATLVLAAAAVAVSVRRRKTLMRETIGGAIGIIVFLAGLRFLHHTFVSSAVKEGFNGQVSSIVFDTLLRFLKQGLWLVLGILVLLAIVQWIVGPARYAAALRHQVARAWHWTANAAKQATSKEHVSAASAGSVRAAGWVREHQSGLRMIGAVVIGIFVVFSGSLTFAGFLIALLILAAYLGLLQLVVMWAGKIDSTEKVDTTGKIDSGVTSSN